MSQYTAPNLTIEASNGTRYAYRRFGNSNATPVVFLQHFRGNLDNWDPALIDDIAAQREVILVDNSGVGLSTGATPHTVEGLASDVLEFIDGLDLAQVDLFGFSMGGLLPRRSPFGGLAWCVALFSGEPAHKAGVISTSGVERPESERTEMPKAPMTPSICSSRPRRPAWRRAPSSSSGSLLARSRDDIPALSVRDAHAEAVSDWGIPDMGKLARLAGITQPTLVANGDNDIMVPTVNSYLLAGHIPNAELIIYPDAGHGFLFQYPHEFAAKVNAFLGAP